MTYTNHYHIPIPRNDMNRTKKGNKRGSAPSTISKNKIVGF